MRRKPRPTSRAVAIVIVLFWLFVAFMVSRTAKNLSEDYASTADHIRYTANAPRA